MLKKLLIVCTITLNVLAGAAFAEESAVNNIVFNGNLITISGETAASEFVTMRMIKKDGTADELSDIYAVMEKKSGEDGKYSFNVKMPELRAGIKTDGEYEIIIHSGTNDVSKSIEFVSETTRKETVDKLSGKSFEDFKAVFEGEDDIRAFRVMGLEINDFSAADENVKNAALTMLYECDFSSESALKNNFNFCFNLAMLNSENDTIKYLNKLEPQFENVKFSDIEENDKASFIGKTIEKAKPYESRASFEKTYNIINILYLCNHEKFSGINQLLAKYEQNLEISDNASYISYKALSGNKLVKANETIVQKLSASPAETVENLVSAIAAGVDAGKNITDISGSGSNSGPGTGSNGSSKRNNNTVSVPPSVKEDLYEEIINKSPQIGFSDLESVEWAQYAIMELYDKKIVAGNGDGTFGPNENVTREAFVKMLVSALDILNENAVSSFEDVNKNGWYYPYISSAFENELVNGISETEFGLGASLTREDMCVLTVRAYEKANDKKMETGEMSFDDSNKISKYAADSINKLNKAGIVKGLGENKFEPKAYCTRAQAAKVIYELLIRK